MKKALLISLLTLTLIGGTTSIASASESDTDVEETIAEQDQELNQNVEVHCTTGAYGQESTCDASASQSGKQSQKIVLRTGEVLGEHTMVDTALDTPTLAMIAGLMVIGAGSFVAYKKI